MVERPKTVRDRAAESEDKVLASGTVSLEGLESLRDLLENGLWISLTPGVQLVERGKRRD